MSEDLTGFEIAVIGLAGRFPGARDVREFWENLANGAESITFFSDEELAAEGVGRETIERPDYVKAAPILGDIEHFAASFFGYSPQEAAILDPQQRLLLECAWEALEDAGYPPGAQAARVGVWAGSAISYYLLTHLIPHSRLAATGVQLELANEKDYLATRISYNLNLSGPSINVETACSTSLVAVHLASQGLISGECDLALAGGVYLRVPPKRGYVHLEGGLYSPDGHCRPFDRRSAGTIFGNGLGLVVLKRLEDALADGDAIRAVIKGSATGNDGSDKVGFAAPGVEGQVRVIQAALAAAEVDPGTLSYVEAHGTGTQLGDPIEVHALTRAFRSRTSKKGFCALGSVKSNVGHLGSAAGVAGLVKTVLALEHRQLPASLHFEEPNPQIDFGETPFFVQTELGEWKADGPRRAGVSSFGMGGANAHVILEEAPAREPSGPSRPAQLVVLSARTKTALDAVARRLSEHLEAHPDQSFADVAFTLKVGRKAERYRRRWVCRDRSDALEVLESLDPRRVADAVAEAQGAPVTFLFSGQGSQYPGMGAGLYGEEKTFREWVDRGAAGLEPLLGLDLTQEIFSGSEERLTETRLAQPALFVVEYALARLWMEWGVYPESMIGHSIGEYVAACLAEVFSFEDALALVAARGRLMQDQPEGSMLGVSLSARELEPLLDSDLALAATNAPKRSVVSGPSEAVAALEQRLTEQGVETRALHTSHAFHSPMMEGALEPFRREVEKVRLAAPRIPFLSNATGTWIEDHEATDPDYWVRHLRGTVRFSEGLAELYREPVRLLLEVGPGRTLGTLARQHPDRQETHLAFSTLHHPKEKRDDLEFLLETVGGLWLAGAHVDWKGFYGDERRCRVPLPTYPFERERYWIEPDGEGFARRPDPLAKKDDLAQWFYVPYWKPSALPTPFEAPADSPQGTWLVLLDETGPGPEIVRQLREAGHDVTTVRRGDRLDRIEEHDWTLRPAEREDYEAVLAEVGGEGPLRVVHLWTVTSEGGTPEDETPAASVLEPGFWSLLALAQALGRQGVTRPVELSVVSNGLYKVREDDPVWPEKAAVLGPVKVLPLESPNVVCRAVDVGLHADVGMDADAEEIVAELAAPPERDPRRQEVAYRRGERRVRAFEPVRLGEAVRSRLPLLEKGVYVVTGGLGGLGLTFARFLADAYRARLVLTGRSASASRHAAEIRLLEQAGAEVLVVAADVTDEEDMHRVKAAARERFGIIDGMIHAAGIPGAGLAQLKSREEAEAVLSPKVRGARVLQRVFEGESLDFFVLCSSVYSVLGEIGQVDYCAANNVLDAFARSGSLPGHLVVSVNWDGWEEVGMAAEAASGPRRRGHGAEVHPLLGRCLEDTDERTVFYQELRVDEQWLLAEHHIFGVPVLPGTAYLEMARAAWEYRTGESAAVELEDVLFLSPLQVPEGEVREIRTVIEKNVGGFHFRVVSGSAPEVEHVALTIAPLGGESPNRWEVNEIVARTVPLEVPEGLHNQGGPVFWGPRWQSLEQVSAGDEEGLALLALPESFTADVGTFALHPALVDVAASLAVYGVGELYLPLSYQRIRVRRPLPARFYVRVSRGGEEPAEREVVTADLVLFDEKGRELVAVEQFALKRVGQAGMDRGTAPGREAAGAGPVPSAPRGPAGGGISPREGVEALRRILSRHRGPEIVASVKDLAAQFERLVERQGEPEAARREAGARFERPSHLESAYTAPESELEKLLAELWQERLGIDRIGIHDNFYELGGDSIVGLSLVARARQKGVRIAPELIFEHPSIAELAAAIEGTPAESAPDADRSESFQVPEKARTVLERLAAENGEIEDVYPLTPLQQGLVLESLEEPESGLYIEVVAQAFEGALDRDAFEDAWRDVVARHGVLRAAVAWEGLDEPLQVIFKSVDVEFRHLDWRDLPRDEQEARLAAFRDSEGRRAFDLARPPLMRVFLVRLGEESYYLVWTHHHVLMDGWSSPIVTREVVELYGARLRGETLGEPPPRPYRDFVAWLGRQDLAAAEAFWRSELRGFERPTGIASLSDERGAEAYEQGRRSLRIPPEITAGLNELARRFQVTLNSVVQGAWGLLLHRITGSDDVVYGLTVSGRPPELDGVESMVGLFINTLPMRLSVAGETPLPEFLAEVQARQSRLLSYSFTPLSQVRAWSEIREGQPLFETSFQFWNFPGLSSRVDDRRFLYEIKTHYPLLVRAIPGDELVIELLYDRRSFTESAVEGWLRRFDVLLGGFVGFREETLAHFLGLLDEADQAERGQAARKVAGAARDKLRKRARQRGMNTDKESSS